MTDESEALQAALDDAVGKTLVFEPGRYHTSRTLWISGHSTRIEGCGALLECDVPGQPAIDCRRVASRVYPQEIRIRQLDIYVTAPGSTAFAVRASHSTFEDICIGLRRGADSAVGFDLIGDEEHGTGPYYNVFKNCSVQGQGRNQIGVRYYHTIPHHRAPNANSWLGGRVGQCTIGFDVSGGGNSFFNPTLEGCHTAFSFDRATENSVFGCYLEVCSTGFAFTENSLGNGVVGIFATGVPAVLVDRGKENWAISRFAPALLMQGAKFGTTSTDPHVLDAYQEGTWAPTVRGSDEQGDYRIKLNSAEYVRVGRQVTLSAELSIEVSLPGRGRLIIGGLPFAPAAADTIVGNLVTARVSWPDGIRSTGLRIVKYDSHFGLAAVGSRDADEPFVLATSDLQDRSTFSLSATYFTRS